MKTQTLWLAATALVAAFMAGCGSSDNGTNGPEQNVPQKPTTSSAATPDVQSNVGGLSIEVTGSCSDSRGFRLKSSGFTPNGTYLTEATFPDGTPYRYLARGGVGTADNNGATPEWTWDCMNGPDGKPDTPGTYTIRLTDLATNRVARTTLEVKYQ